MIKRSESQIFSEQRVRHCLLLLSVQRGFERAGLVGHYRFGRLRDVNVIWKQIQLLQMWTAS